jgi:hypothetical protein
MQKSGQINLLPAGNLSLQMDGSSGVEQLLLIISPDILDLRGIAGFPSNALAAIPAETTRARAEHLAGWWRNAEVESVAETVRKIVIEGNDPPQDPPDARGLGTLSSVGGTSTADNGPWKPFHAAAAPNSPGLPFW